MAASQSTDARTRSSRHESWQPVSPISPSTTAAQTPSLLFNNLAISTEGMVAFARQQEAVLIDTDRSLTQVVQSRSRALKAMGVHFLELQQTQVLVVTSTSGAEFWVFDSPGAPLRLGAVFHLNTLLPPRETGDVNYARGVTVVPSPGSSGTGPGKVAVGLSTGQVCVLEVGIRSNVRMLQQLVAHSAPVSVLASSDEHVVSASDDGEIIIWSATMRRLDVVCGQEFPCTGLAIRGNMLLAAFATGLVHVFTLDPHDLVVEIAAHSRCITSLALHLNRNLFATVGEDQMLMVWEFSQFDDDKGDLSLAYSCRVDHALLTGVAFLDHGMRCRIAATVYDSSDIRVWEVA